MLASVLQLHVLTFTVHQLLSALSPTLNSGDLDPCMNMLIDVSAASPCNFYLRCRVSGFSFLHFLLLSLLVPLSRSSITSCLGKSPRRKR